eukprot:1160457-Pelagomonas_calceolata.AAC.12
MGSHSLITGLQHAFVSTPAGSTEHAPISACWLLTHWPLTCQRPAVLATHPALDLGPKATTAWTSCEHAFTCSGILLRD